MRTGKPVVLCFSGLDPSGGAGLQADIETLQSLGCHCAPVATVLTVQDTVNASEARPVAPELMVAQARAVLADLRVRCCKIGLTGGADSIRAIGGLLREFREIPIVLDPVSAAGGGFTFQDAGALAALRETLLPLTTVLTPNTMESMTIATAESPESAAAAILQSGCQNVLLTGGHASGPVVLNRWYRREGPEVKAQDFHWTRLGHEYHGSGCTLASAVAGFLALGCGLEEALRQAQEFAWRSLGRAWQAGKGQHLPDRRSARQMGTNQ